ncbi:hypothetical protein S245_038479, partial [Arachis hypogaea]
LRGGYSIFRAYISQRCIQELDVRKANRFSCARLSSKYDEDIVDQRKWLLVFTHNFC